LSDGPNTTQAVSATASGGSIPAPQQPRALTPKALRRSWVEPSVRGWWLTAAILLALVAWLVIEQVIISRETAQRIQSWRLVKANVDKLEAGARFEYTSRATYYISPEDLPSKEAILSFPEPTGSRRIVGGYLKAQNHSIHPGETVDILVDPENPKKWTDRVHPEPLAAELIVPLLPAPLPIILVGLALWQRKRLLRTWQTGVKRAATVVASHKSAASPRSDIVRCAVKDHRDKRVVRVTVPHAAARLGPGDAIELVTPATELTPALAAMLYE
jgi:hypothetical protein